jgi:hypothetical protein
MMSQRTDPMHRISLIKALIFEGQGPAVQGLDGAAL